MHQGVTLVNLTDATGQNEKGVLLRPIRVDPTGDTVQPVSIVSGGSGGGPINDGVDGTIKATVLDLTNSNPLTVAIVDTAGTQISAFPVTGTITANQGTSPWVTSGTSTVSGTVTVTQGTGTNLHTVIDSGTITSITNALPAGTNVIGHVIADSGSTTAVTQATGTNLHAVIDSGSITAVQGTGTNLHTVVDSGNIAVTGTVTANAGTNLNTSLLALDSTQTNKTQFTRITDGTTDGTFKAASTAPAATDTALVVTLNPNNTVNTVAYKVDGSAVTQPVSGTVAATKSGDWPVQGVDELAKTVESIHAATFDPSSADIGLVVRDTNSARTRRLQEAALLNEYVAFRQSISGRRGYELR